MAVFLKCLLVLAVATSVAIAGVSAATNCVAGDGTDFSSLSGTDFKVLNGGYNYILNICGKVTSEATCSGKGASLCQYDTSSPPAYKHVMATWDATGTWATCSDATNCPNGGYQVTFQNGDSCPPNRQVTFQFACTEGADVPTYVVNQLPGVTCQYDTVIQTSAACPGSSGGGGNGGDSGKKGISGGTVFLIILVVVVPVYIVVGCVYKRQRMGTAGMESCPNIDFWRDFPSLVGDGFKFTWRKLMGLCGKGGDGTYESVK